MPSGLFRNYTRKQEDRKSTRLNSSHLGISYAVFCLKKKIIKQLISEELRQRFGKASNVLVLTGAGVSAESGVPTFRGGGNSAVWKGMPFSVISSVGMVERDLPEVWEWFNYRRGRLALL